MNNNHNLLSGIVIGALLVLIIQGCIIQYRKEDEITRTRRLVASLDYYDPERRWIIQELISKDSYSVPFLVEDIVKPENAFSDNLNLAVIYTLGEIGRNAYPAVPVLVYVLDNEDYYVTQESVRALAKIGSPSVSALIGATYDIWKEMGKGYYAIEALGMIGPDAEDALPRLYELTNHRTPEIAEKAEWAISEITKDSD